MIDKRILTCFIFLHGNIEFCSLNIGDSGSNSVFLKS